MELSSRPRHQIRAQGRRRGQAGIVIVENEISRVRWHPGGDRQASANTVIERKKQSRGSLELLEFLSRTAVQSEKELLADLDEAKPEPDKDSLTEFRRIIANVQKNDRSAFRSLRTNEAGANAVMARTPVVDPDEAIESHVASWSSWADEASADSARSREIADALTRATPNPAPAVAPDSYASSFSSLVEYHTQNRSEKVSDPSTEGDVSGGALRSLLKELNDWLSADNMATTGSDSTASTNAFTNAQASGQTSFAPDWPARPALMSDRHLQTSKSTMAVAEEAINQVLQEQSNRIQSRFGFEQAEDWSYFLPQKVAEGSRARREVSGKLSPMLDVARRMVVGIKNLPLGRRIESHENGAILEKDELGRVTQIRAGSGEIISIYYGRDGAPEGFVRTDAKGALHSVAECDQQGVVLRDENGRVRAAGESLSIDPLGRISICRSDGQYWSIDLARQMLSEKRRLADQNGKWTALTAVFAADGFRMMTLFQKLSPSVGKTSVSSHDDANRIWSNAAVEAGHFRFYGRDGSTIEFGSEEGLENLAPVHVSSPGVRPIEPRWRAKHQAGTAWQSVHEYVVSYLAI